MSKTKGNVLDPLDVIDKYGTDALRSVTPFCTSSFCYLYSSLLCHLSVLKCLNSQPPALLYMYNYMSNCPPLFSSHISHTYVSRKVHSSDGSDTWARYPSVNGACGSFEELCE